MAPNLREQQLLIRSKQEDYFWNKGKPRWKHQTKNTRKLHWYNLFKAVIYLSFLFNQITGRRRVHGEREHSSTSHHKPEEATLEIHYAINRDGTNSLSLSSQSRDSYAILCVLDPLNDCVRWNNHTKVGTEELRKTTKTTHPHQLIWVIWVQVNHTFPIGCRHRGVPSISVWKQ